MLLMGAFAALWALVEALAAGVLRDYSPYQVVWTRYGVHLALMLALFGWRDAPALWRTRRPGLQFGRSMLMVGMPASWVVASQLGVPPSTLLAVFWLSPLLVLLLARVLLRERVAAPLWAAAAGGYVGALLLYRGAGAAPSAAWLSPLAMALCLSLYIVLTRALRDEATRTNLFYTALGVFVVLTPAMPEIWRTPQPMDLAVMIAVGVLGTVTLYALDRAAHEAPVAITAPFVYVQIAVTLAIAAAAGADAGASPRRAAVALALIGVPLLLLWLRASRAAEPLSFKEP